MISEKDINRNPHVIYADSLREIIIHNHKHGGTKGTTTHVPEIDEIFRWEERSVNIWGGYAGMGKSTILNILKLLRVIYSNKKIGIFTPETYPPEYYYNQLIQAYVGLGVEKYHHNQMTIEQHLAALDFIKSKFFYISSNNLDEVTPVVIFKIFEDLIKDEGITDVVIDPFNQLDRDWERSKRDDRYVGDFCVQSKRFAVKHDVIVDIVVHPPASAAKKEKGQDEYKILDIYDFAGGAQWANKSDNMLVYYRPYFCRDRKNTECVLKSIRIKKYGLNGFPGQVFLTYDFEKNRYFIFDRDIFDVDKPPILQQTIFHNFTEPDDKDDTPF